MTQVETRAGRVEGILERGVLQFRGIPFAASPVGDLRWRPPQPAEPWAGVRPAQGFGPMAPQGPSRFSFFTAAEQAEIGEDGCLTLNVSPPATDGDPPPVLPCTPTPPP